jgi:hypothetical protein
MVVVASTVDTLSTYADEVLAIAVDALADTAAGTPANAYTTAAPDFAWDCCPFVTVFVPLLREQTTSPIAPVGATARRGQFGSVILATYIVTVARCAPELQQDGFPLPAAIEAVADQVRQDGWALWNGFRHALANKEIFTDCEGAFFDGGDAIREQGNCVGWQFTLRAQIPGIPNPGPSS